jgi:alpha-L-rhamnosidase
MKKNGIAVIVFFLFFSGSGIINQFCPENLNCEYLHNPIGIDAANPRFTWQMMDKRQGASWKAYQVIVGTDSSEVAGGKGNMWESGKIKSSLVPVIYQGQKLNPFTRYYWNVKIQDENGDWSHLSQISFFETGMMGNNWKGDWITDKPDYNIKPAPYFRKNFNISKKIKSARLYIAAAGLYELYLNGDKIGDHRLDPMYTRYDRRLLYVTHDVTQNLQNGENIIGVLLGNGWFNYQSLFRFNQAPWRARPKFCLDLRITYEDGSIETVTSGNEWKTALSPVIFNSIYTGEHYDARLEKPGWNMPGYNDSSWKKIFHVGAPTQNIESQVLHPIRITEEIPAKEMVRIDTNTFLFDFGKNFSGASRIKVSGSAGTTIRLKHAERLDTNGRADQSNIDMFNQSMGGADPFQTDIFILSGKGEEAFMPRFNYKGFQYVEVTADKPVKLTKDNLTAYFMHSDVPVAGTIKSSNPTLNKIWQAANASYLSNLFGFLTDCPTREKNGWTNDAHVSIETGLFNLDCITIFEKWLVDFKYEQQANGVLPAIVPTTDGYGYDWGNGVDLTSSIAIIPWEIYLFYGDSRLLESCYENIRRYVNHINDISPSGLTDWGLGDWTPIKSKATVEFTSSTYFYIDAVILSKAAKLFKKQTDFEKYTVLAEKIKNAINKKYLNLESGIYGSGLQTELSMALVWGLVPEGVIGKVAGNLSERVIADDSHIDVGELGTRTILNALSENGYSDLAYKAALRETYPSWGWWIVNGATTLYEYWVLGEKKSMNHHMFGEISAWFYKGLGGIFPDESNPGFKNVVLKPNFVSGLEEFEASHKGPYGIIISSWKKSGEEILYNVTIPANSTAKLCLNAIKVLESGKELSENKQIRVEKGDDQILNIYLKAGDYKFSVQK